MIARFRILLRSALIVPAESSLPSLERPVPGYIVRVHPPYRVDIDVSDRWNVPRFDELWARLEQPVKDQPVAIVIDDHAPGVLANALCIDFWCEAFDRKRSAQASNESNAPVALAFDVANSIISSIRARYGAVELRPVSPNTTVWRMDYLDDDGNKLPKLEGHEGGRGGAPIKLAPVVALNTASWEGLSTGPVPLHPWDALLLDAQAILPEIGPAMVLANAALESFIARVLDSLALSSSTIPHELWKWINDRGDWRKEPSVTEQFDVLLKVLTGRSLKGETQLWSELSNLRKVRNAFSHEGTAVLGTELITSRRCAELVNAAERIIAWVEEGLPTHLKRPRQDRPKATVISMIWAGDEVPNPDSVRLIGDE